MAKRINPGPLVAVAFLGVAGVLAWKFYPRPAPAPAPVLQSATPAAAEAPAPAAYPIEEVAVQPEPAAEPLPALEDSDSAAWDALSALLEGGDLAQWLLPTHLVQRLVITIDALPRRDITGQVYVAKPVAGALVVDEAAGAVYLGAANFARYDAAVAVFERVDPRALVSAYVRLYPLFQQAWREIGPPGSHFNDRLVAVIDHVLAAPAPAGPVALVPAEGRPRWEFADPAMEQASIGHKALWRMGPDHAVRVKAKLSQLRELLVAQRPAG